MDLPRLREQVEQLTLDLARRRYRLAAGLETSAGFTDAFRAAPEVTEWDAIELVRDARASAEGRRASRLRALEAHLVQLVIQARSARLLDELVARSGAEVPAATAGRTWPLYLSLALGPREPDRDARHRIESAAMAAALDVEALLSEYWEIAGSVAQLAGNATPFRQWGFAHDIDPAALTTEAAAFLHATQAMYLDVAEWWLRRTVGVHLFPHGAERHDLLHALTISPFDGLFPRGSGIKGVLDLFRGMGLSASADGGLRLDGEPRARKVAEPLCARLDAPDDVVAVYRAESGFASTRALLRAWGESLHSAHVEAERPFEDRMLGDRSLPAAFGVLFQHVLLDPKWLRAAVGLEPPDLLRVIALAETHRLRHAAAIVVASSAIDREGPRAGLASAFSDRLSAALGARWPAALWMWECRPTLGAATELLAAAFAATLFPQLRERFNEDWWRNPQAGPFLLKIFRQGQLESSRGVLKAMDLGEPRLTPLIHRLEDLLG
jgi:hypothetical protein